MPRGIFKHKKCSKETKLKISEAMKGKNTWMKGRKHSEETRKRISEALKGKMPKNIKQIVGWNKGTKGVVKANKTSFQKGHHSSSELKKGHKMSKKVKYKISKKMSGENCHFWKGGITPENHRIRASIEYRLWRESVFARDNWICQKTGVKGGKLQAHHIHNFADYPKLRTSIENGITLCINRHKEFHKIYGNKNNTQEQLKEFLNK